MLSNSKFFWSYDARKHRASNPIPTSVYLGEKYANEDNGKADLFASHFTKFYSTENVSKLARQNVYCILGSAEISREGLLEALMQINANKRAGPDGIPPPFLKECAKPLVEPFYIIFNLSLKKGCFPTGMKSSYITSVY